MDTHIHTPTHVGGIIVPDKIYSTGDPIYVSMFVGQLVSSSVCTTWVLGGSDKTGRYIPRNRICNSGTSSSFVNDADANLVPVINQPDKTQCKICQYF